MKLKQLNVYSIKLFVTDVQMMLRAYIVKPEIN